MIRINAKTAKQLGIQLPKDAIGAEIHGASAVSKYRARRITVDGLSFDSQAEARRWSELKIEEKVGRIRGLERQISYFLHVTNLRTGEVTEIGSYRADFEYWRGALRVVEDVKGGPLTALYRWKKKHVEAEHNVVVQEIR